MQSTRLDDGYVKVCVDSEDALAIIEVAVPVSTIVPADNRMLETLLALQIMVSPSQSGKRLFPALDMRSEHLVMSYVAGSESVRSEEDLLSLAETCFAEVALLVKNARASQANPGTHPYPPIGISKNLGRTSRITK